MGIDYYNCDHCDEITDDCGFSKEFNIEGWDENYLVCEKCALELQKMLLLSKPLTNACAVEEKMTKKRMTFKNLDALKDWMKDKQEENYEFFVYKDNNWNDVLQEAWIGEGKCGGMDEAQIIDVIEKNQMDELHVMLYAGWRDHEISYQQKKSLRRSKLKTCSALSFKFYRNRKTDSKQIFKNIQDYAKLYGLEDRPFFITGCPKTLRRFCLPYTDENIIEASSIKDIERLLEDPRLIDDFDDVTWIATESFLKFKETQMTQEVSRLNKRLLQIDELRHHANKKHKPNPNNQDNDTTMI